MPTATHIQWSDRPVSSSCSSYNDDGSSYRSASTTPTTHSTRPSEQSSSNGSDPFALGAWQGPKDWYRSNEANPQASAETYTNSSRSVDELEDDLPPFEVADTASETGIPAALASSPSEFADYFPSTHRMSIKHDDSTLDGNMNLRIDTLAQMSDGTKADLTLFHLRMHDLKRRDFSLRRHCRNSGREVCHSTRKYQKPSIIRRPMIQRSMSSALSGLRSKSENRTPTMYSLKRQDSGYDSMDEEEIDVPSSPRMSNQAKVIPIPTNTTMLEFSNYAHLEVRRRGAKASKRYEFSYWGVNYSWKRVSKASGDFKEISYHLVNTKTSASVAHIVPVPLSRSESREEEAKGGWVPPCSMWISDESVLDQSLDVAEVIVASGLIALVDDCIKSRWHQKRRVQMTIPLLSKSPKKASFDQSGPKRVLDEVFNRSENHRPTPLRQLSC